MLKKENRLTKKKYFNYIYKKGQACYSGFVIVNFSKTKYKDIKIGFSVSKKIGKAVIRNLVKRRLRAIIEVNLQYLNKNYNYIITAKKGIEELTFLQLKQEVENCLIKNNLLAKKDE